MRASALVGPVLGGDREQPLQRICAEPSSSLITVLGATVSELPGSARSSLLTTSWIERFRNSAIPMTRQTTCSAGSRGLRSVAVPVPWSDCRTHSGSMSRRRSSNASGLMSATASSESRRCIDGLHRTTLMPFLALDLSLDLIRGLRPTIELLRRKSPRLRRQLEDSLAGIVQNVCEGSGRTVGVRPRRGSGRLHDCPRRCRGSGGQRGTGHAGRVARGGRGDPAVARSGTPATGQGWRSRVPPRRSRNTPPAAMIERRIVRTIRAAL
jgi:hypothetical protein